MTKARVRNTTGVGHNHFFLMQHSRQTPKIHNSKTAKTTKQGAKDNGKNENGGEENGEKDETESKQMESEKIDIKEVKI